MNDSQLKYLRDNQQELGLKLLIHARWLASTRYGWTGTSKTLPLGKDPEDIVCEVLDDYLHDIRHFNPKHGIDIQLKRAISSELWSLHKRAEARAIPLEDDHGEQSPRGYDEIEPLPDAQAATEHDLKVLFELLRAHPSVKGNDELELLLMAVEDGAEGVEELSQATEIREERLYELRKKLKKIWPKVLDEFKKGTEATP